MTSSSSKTCYADFTHPSVKDAINLNNFSTFKLALLENRKELQIMQKELLKKPPTEKLVLQKEGKEETKKQKQDESRTVISVSEKEGKKETQKQDESRTVIPVSEKEGKKETQKQKQDQSRTVIPVSEKEGKKETQKQKQDQSGTVIPVSEKEGKEETQKQKQDENRKRKFLERKNEAELRKKARSAAYTNILQHLEEEFERLQPERSEVQQNVAEEVNADTNEDHTIKRNTENEDDVDVDVGLSNDEEDYTLMDLVPLNAKGYPTIAQKVPRKQHSESLTSEEKYASLEEKFREKCRENDVLKCKLSEAYREIEELRSNSRDESEDLTLPKPGILSPNLAQKYKMVELLPGTNVYLYQHDLDTSLKLKDPKLKGTATHGKRMARLLMNCFFHKEMFINATLSENATGKRLLNQKIIDAIIIAEFAQHMAAAHEHFSKEIQSLISTFRRKNYELKKQRPADTPSTIYKTWDSLLHETEMDAQAHLDAASLLIKNVYKPLEEVATYKQSQAQKLNSFRDTMESMLEKMEDQLQCAEKDYLNAYNLYQKSATSTPEDQESAKINLYNAHNEYIFQLRASNRTVDEFRIVIPQILEELEEIYIDTSNTINAAIESHALLLLTKANEQHKRFEDLLKICRQVNPKLDISFFVNALNPECAKIELHYHNFNKPDSSNNTSENSMTNQLISDSGTEINLQNRRAKLQKEASELTSYIKQNQDVTNALVNICQRNLGNHLYSKVYETQEDLCRKRNEIRMGNMKLASIRAQIELLTPKQNGSVENDDQEKSSASIKTMWKKAFKSLKTSSAENKLTKKASFIKKKQRSKEEEAEPEPQHSGDIDPVYSLLKCAADLPKAGKSCGLHPHCSGHHGSLRHSNTSTAVADSSGSTSKTSSPSSSVSQSPKARRKKLNARMKSFSLDTPDPPKHLLGIDETTKKKSSSFTNTCFGGGIDNPHDRYSVSAINLRKKFASTNRASSLEYEDKKAGSHSPSPRNSPKSLKKQQVNPYVVLYNFRGKEKDDLDLRAGWRVNVTDSSDQDWWKGKYGSRSGYFPAAYVIPLQPGQRVFQVTQAMLLTEGENGMKLHKDQIVLQAGEENDGMIHVMAANNKQAVCPLKYLNECL